MSDRVRTEEQISLLEEELEDLARQVAEGDLDEGTADRLAARYRAELTDLRASLASLDRGDADIGPPVERRSRRVSGRALVGAAIVGVAIVAVGVFAVTSLDDGTAGAEGIVNDVLTGEGGVDLSAITNDQMEEVVAANPDVVGMRLALARRYFEGGEFDRALDHYMEVLEREQNPEALANVGWMTYLSNRPDVAVGYLEAALQRNPDYLPAKWFIANIYVDLGRADEAVAFLVEVISANQTPDEVRQLAARLLEQIEGSP